MSNAPSRSTASSPAPKGRSSRLPAVLIALAFGALAGALAVLLFRPQALVDRAEQRLATPGPTVTVTETPSPPPGMTRLTVDVPDACVETLRRSGASAAAIRDLVNAVQGLQLGRARELAGQLNSGDLGRLGNLAQDCGGLLAAAVAASPSPSPSPGP